MAGIDKASATPLVDKGTHDRIVTMRPTSMSRPISIIVENVEWRFLFPAWAEAMSPIKKAPSKLIARNQERFGKRGQNSPNALHQNVF